MGKFSVMAYLTQVLLFLFLTQESFYDSGYHKDEFDASAFSQNFSPISHQFSDKIGFCFSF